LEPWKTRNRNTSNCLAKRPPLLTYLGNDKNQIYWHLSNREKIKQTSSSKIGIVSGYAKRENGRPLQNAKENVEDLSSRMEGSTKNTDKQIQWRRAKVLELSSQGNSQSDIAKTLHVGEATVSRDISSLRQQAQLNLRTHINDKLPEEYQTVWLE
jgi:Fic family protein